MTGTELQIAKIHRIRQRGSLQDLVGHAERVELVDGRTVGALIRVRRFTNKSLIHPAVRPAPSLRFKVA